MDKQRWQQIQDVFRHLANKSPSHRQDYLAMVCEEDDELRREIEALLQSHDKLERGAHDPETTVLQAVDELQGPQTVGQYRILDELGRGGMGVVYLAEHPRHGKVALKLLPRFTVASEEAERRFALEARVLSSLRHPALSRLKESFVTEDYAAISMECIDGRGLDELVDKGALPLARALTIILDLSDALAEAHALGVTHRDIKPNNVLLNQQGQTKLIDFGIAKFADIKLTVTGQVLGTPGYMSPEQWSGKGLDSRSDLWSLGVLLYELLTATNPFKAKDRIGIARLVLTAPSPALPAKSCDDRDLGAVQSVLDRLLEKDPEQRLQSCDELSAGLRSLM